MSSNSSAEEKKLVCLKQKGDNDTHSGKKRRKSAKSEAPSPSMRPKMEEEQFNDGPEIQKHVAKKLSKLLDKKLEQAIGGKILQVKNKQKTCKGGIKLFSTSEQVIKKIKDDVRIRKLPRVVKKSQKITNDDLKSVAVNSEDILSQKETKSWSNWHRHSPFRYKNINGQLIAIG